MLRTVLTIALITSAACEKSKGTPEAPKNPPEASQASRVELPSLLGYVALAPGAALYRKPGDAEPAFLRGSSSEPTVYRAIRREGEWIEVESMSWNHRGRNAASRADVCGATREPALDNLKLRFFVREEALYPVLTKELVARIGEREFAEVKPGVALPEKRADGKRLLAVDGLRVAVAVPDSHVGRSFDHLARFGPSDAPAEFLLSAQRIDEGALVLGGVAVEREAGRETGVAVQVLEERGATRLVEVRRGCVRIGASIESDALVAPSPEKKNRYGGIVGHEVGATVHKVAVKSPVLWRGGETAGEVAKQVMFTSASEPDGERQCFYANTTSSEGHPPLEFCFQASDVTTIPGMP